MRPGVAQPRDAVLDRVLDERLEQHRRHLRMGQAAVGVDGELQPPAEPRLLDVEIGAREGKLLIERRPLLVGSPQRVAEHFGELLDRRVGSRRIGVNERRNRVERVEQEMRIDLRAQRLELRAARLQPQFLRELLLFQASALQAHVLEHETEDAAK